MEQDMEQANSDFSLAWQTDIKQRNKPWQKTWLQSTESV